MQKMDKVVNLFSRIQTSLECNNVAGFFLKPKQVACWESLLNGHDVLAVLPTGYGKSLIYQLLPDFLPRKCSQNIVIVVTPLTSIIEDQIKTMEAQCVPAGVLNTEREETSEIISLFSKDITHKIQITENVKLGKIKILFSHPESILSAEGMRLLKSPIFRQNVAACVIDEAHCVELWGEDFRKSFGDLATLKALFPTAVTLALTATAPLAMVEKITDSLSISSCKIVRSSPNRPNIKLTVRKRMPNNYSKASYDEILLPMTKGLNRLREKFPMTIIYMKLKYCGYAFKLFNSKIKDPFVGENCVPANRLFAQFHAPTTKLMKYDIIEEIRKENSNIRVIFATAALGMGVNIPHVTKVIHITPPATLESYLQEFGRAGRNGNSSSAIIYYNNSDISENNKIMSTAMKEYCTTTNCLRKTILTYFGFSCQAQVSCCSNCNGDENHCEDKELNHIEKKTFRPLDGVNFEKLRKELFEVKIQSELALFHVLPPSLNFRLE